MQPQPSSAGLFREEAVRRYLRAREFGDVLRLPPRWTRVLYPIVVALLLLGSAWLAFGEVPRHARGPGLVRPAAGGGFELVALLPATCASELRRGSLMKIGAGAHQLPIDSIDPRPLEACEAQALLAAPGIPPATPSGPVIVVRADFPVESTAPFAATVEVELRPERPVFTLFPGLRAALR